MLRLGSTSARRPTHPAWAVHVLAMCLVAAILLQVPSHIAHLRSHHAPVAACGDHGCHTSSDTAPADPSHDDCPTCELFAQVRHAALPIVMSVPTPFMLTHERIGEFHERVFSLAAPTAAMPRGPPTA